MISRRSIPSMPLLPVGLLLAAIACTPPAEPVPLSEEALLGTWSTTARYGGQETRIGLAFHREGEGPITATLDLPAAHAWNAPVGDVTLVDGSEVHIADWVLRWNPLLPALGAVLPPGLVPVHEVPIVLTRSEPVLPAPASPREAPVAEPVWTFDAGAPIWAGVSYSDGTVYAGSDSGEVLALAARDGRLRWRTSTGGAIRATPTVDGDRVFVPADDGGVYRLDARTGGVDWGVPVVVDPYERGARYDYYAAAATVAGDDLYVGTADGLLCALDVADGSVRWTFRAEDSIATTPVVAEGRVFVGSFDGNVYAVDALTGEELWRRQTGAAIASSGALADGLFLIGSRSYDLLALDPASGETVWSYYYWFSWVDSTPTIVGDTVYIGSSDALKLLALDLATGKPRWAFDTRGWTWPRPAVGESAVFIGTIGTAGYIGERSGEFLAVDREDGTLRWWFGVEPPAEDAPGSGAMWGFASSPAAADGLVFVGGLDNVLYAFEQ